jgi:hemolysin III
MLGFSAAYNTWPVSPTKRVLRRFDHSAIFLMIAGTYTPFIAQMKGNLVAMGLLISVWLTAVVGIILKRCCLVALIVWPSFSTCFLVGVARLFTSRW